MLFYDIIIAPIERVIEIVFCFSMRKFFAFGAGFHLLAVSLAINFLALPLYNVADALQNRERNLRKSLAPKIAHIKRAFSGDERFFMLQTFYRQSNWSPIFALRSSLPILIELPFFIAAYHFLSNCEALKGASFWILRDLGSPDGLLQCNMGG